MYNLLSSERTYTYYLALVCDIYIPVAQGRLVLMNLASGLPDLWREGGNQFVYLVQQLSRLTLGRAHFQPSAPLLPVLPSTFHNPDA